MTAKHNAMTIYHDVPCPFCSLLCDDLVIHNNKGSLVIRKNGCHLARQHFEQPPVNLEPEIKGKPVSLNDAVQEAVRILKKSRQPLIGGLGTDVNGSRAAMHLAEKTGAVVDHMHSTGAIRNIRVLQDRGWMTTTMAEIKNRADLILFAGTDGITNYPRFFERVIWNDSAMFNRKLDQREIIYLGDKLKPAKGKNRSTRNSGAIQCKQEQIGEIIATLHALVVGNEIDLKSVAGVKLTDLQKLAGKLKQARYGVIVWAPGELDFPHAELTVEAISELIKYLNRETRFAGFSLGGNDGGVTAHNVSTWLNGYPLRVNYGKGFPEFDPYKYSTRNVLKRREIDAMLWISSFNSDIKPPNARIPRIVLSDTAVGGPKPTVFIPTGIPGLDHGGQLIRTDGVVSLPLKQLRETGRPSVSSVLLQILNTLQSG